MILPDVNILVYAFKRESPQFQAYSAWLNQVVAGAEELALVDTVLAGFARIATSRRIFASPAPTSEAFSFVERLMAAPRARWVPSGSIVWNIFGELVNDDPLITGNRVPDAYLAATAIAHKARLATDDRGFARYPGLDFFAPVP